MVFRTFLILLLFSLALSQQCSYPYQRCICTTSTPYCPCSSITPTSALNFSSTYYSHLVLLNGFGCRPCLANCLKCTAITTCTLCIEQYQLTLTLCVPCPVNCKQCANGICQTCIDMYYLDYQLNCQKCPLTGTKACTIDSLLFCQSNYWLDNNGATCVNCDPNCQNCSSTTKCTVCNSAYYQNQYLCSPCRSDCLTCSNANSCITCLMTSSFYNSTANGCMPCPTNCLKCNNSGVCVLCSNYNGYALSTSTNNCVLVANTSMMAYPKCVNITASASKSLACASCAPGYYQITLSYNNSALPQNCFYGCSITCLYCEGPHYGLCSQCINSVNFNLLNKNCIAKYNINGGTAFQLFYTANNNNAFFNAPTLISPNSCWHEYVKGGSKSITFQLSKLAAYKINVQWKIYKYNFDIGTYTSSLNQTYQISLSNNLLKSSLSSTFNPFVCEARVPFSSLCNETSFKQCIDKSSYIFDGFISSTNNTITFTSPNSLIAIAQLLVIGYRCGGLYGTGCAQCSDINTCTKCVNPLYFIIGEMCIVQCPSTYYTYYQLMTCFQLCPSSSFSDDSLHQCFSCQSPCHTCSSLSTCITCLSGFFYNPLTLKCELTCPTKFYADSFRKVCERCVNPCLDCVDNFNCRSCMYGYLNVDNLINQTGKCVLQCDNGQFGSLLTTKCEMCIQPCKTCNLLGSFCDSCISLYFLYQNTCLSECTNGFFGNITTKNCDQCPNYCKTCLSLTFCTSCEIGSYLNQLNHCISTCPIRYFADQINLVCIPCNTNCRTCHSQTICSSCENGYYFYEQNYECLINCPAFYYEQSQNISKLICSKCQLPCYDCNSKSFCVSCYDAFLWNGSCSLNCPSGTFQNVSALVCSPCDLTKCVQCVNSATQCSECSSGLLLTNGKCVSSCPNGFYFSSYKQQCINCQGLCKTCTNQTFCLTCIEAFILISTTGTCVSECSFGYYKFYDTISNKISCLKCQKNCQQCSLPTTLNTSICTLCDPSFVLSSGICLFNCPSGYWNYSNTCYPCADPCKTCSDQYQCLTCIDGAGYMYKGACLTQCPYGYYVGTANVCIKCAVGCLLCQGQADQCIACQENYFLLVQAQNSSFTAFKRQCLAICTDGYFASVSDSTCQKCSTNCLTCSSYYDYCTKCKPNMYLVIDMCYLTCPSGYFADSIKNICYNCPSSCQTCDNTTYCTACTLGYFRNNSSQCVSTCPSDQYPFDGLCRACGYPCASCISQTQCLSCISGMHYMYSCLNSCPQRTFLLKTPTQQCIKCSINCSKCISLQKCLFCEQGVLVNGYCNDSCPQGYYDYYGVCAQCEDMCQICNEGSTCLKCSKGFLYDKQCVNTCPTGLVGQNTTYANATFDLKCVICSGGCKQCVINTDKCIQCSPLNYLYLDKCLKTCPSGSYPDINLMICQSCVSPCQTCVNAYSCSTCIYGYLLYRQSQRNQCVQGPACPNSYYLNTESNVCQFVCQSNYFIDNFGKTCSLKCSSKFVTYTQNKSCLQTCPLNMWIDETLTCQYNSTRPQLLPQLKCQPIITRNLLFIMCTSNLPLKNIGQLKTSYFSLSNDGTIDKIYTINDTTFYILTNNMSSPLKMSYLEVQISKKYFLIAKSITYPFSQDELSIIKPTSIALAQRAYPIQNIHLSILIKNYIPYSLDQRQIGMSFYQIAQSISYGALVIWFFSMIKNVKATSLRFLNNLQWLFGLSLLNYDAMYPPNFSQFLQGFKSSCLFGFDTHVDPNAIQKTIWSIDSLSREQFWAINNYYQLNSALFAIYMLIASFIVIYLITLIFSRLFKNVVDQQYLYLSKLSSKFLILNQRFEFNYTFQVLLFSVGPISILLNLQLIHPNVSSFIPSILLVIFYLVFILVCLWIYYNSKQNNPGYQNRKPMRATAYFFISFIQILVQTAVIVWANLYFYVGFGLITIILKTVSYSWIYLKVEPERSFILQSVQVVKGVVLVVIAIGQMKQDTWSVTEIYYFGFVQIVAVFILIILLSISVTKQLFALQSSYKAKHDHPDSSKGSSNKSKKDSQASQHQTNSIQSSGFQNESDYDQVQSFFTHRIPIDYSQDQESSDGDIIDFDQSDNVQNQNGHLQRKLPPTHLYKYQKNQNQTNFKEE